MHALCGWPNEWRELDIPCGQLEARRHVRDLLAVSPAELQHHLGGEEPLGGGLKTRWWEFAMPTAGGAVNR